MAVASVISTKILCLIVINIKYGNSLIFFFFLGGGGGGVCRGVEAEGFKRYLKYVWSCMIDSSC